MMGPFEIIDISQPIDSQTACFPGDTAFQRNITVHHDQSGVINLSAFTMSPHVGTHADAPVHIQGDLNQPAHNTETVGQLPLTPFMGPTVVVDLSPHTGEIGWHQVESQLMGYSTFPQRILFKTSPSIRYDVFEDTYPCISVDLAEKLIAHHVLLVGIDTPSVDAIDSKTLETHHALLKGGVVWLENLDLSALKIRPHQPETYFLSALPLKFMSLEASPVRAVLLKLAP
ncbi:cyclase family protein [Vampirovibrio sp.]|uniref:cyclase family protein n=1 Tax=Vampirovibrio sp. TaxID=2717857 RepID=UPI0035938041